MDKNQRIYDLLEKYRDDGLDEKEKEEMIFYCASIIRSLTWQPRE